MSRPPVIVLPFLWRRLLRRAVRVLRSSWPTGKRGAAILPALGLALSLARDFQCNNMPTDFCAALLQNDARHINREFNAFLATLDARGNATANFEAVTRWLAEKPCVARVEPQPGMIRTMPPIKEFVVYVKQDTSEVLRSLGVRVLPDRYESNLR